MKKFITYALVLLSAIFLAIGLAACDTDTIPNPNATPHTEHTFGAWTPRGDHKTHYQTCAADDATNTEECEYTEVVVAATCEAGGSKRLVCPTCGDAIVIEETPALGHKYPDGEDWISDGNGWHYKVCENDPSHRLEVRCTLEETVVAAKCDEEGYTVFSCDVCGYSHIDDFVQPLGHDYPETWEQDAESKTHSNVCQREGCGHVEAGACDFVTETVYPTCEDKGYTRFTCKDCGLTYQDLYVSALGHKWKDEYKPLSGTGAEHKHSRVCENDPAHTQEAFCEFTQEVNAATCTAEGFTTHVCPLCEYSYTSDRTEKLDHVWGAWTHDEGASTHSRSCENGNCTEIETQNCDVSETTVSATCTAAGSVTRTCDVCKNTEIEQTDALGHDYGDPVYRGTGGKNEHVYTCERAGCIEETEGHTKTEECVMKSIQDVPHCTESVNIHEICEKCNYSEDIGDIAPVGHTWKNTANPEGWTQTTEDGKPAHSRTCSVCGTTETAECSLTVTVTDATCTAGKTETSECAHCGYKNTEVKSEALGHICQYIHVVGTKQHTIVCQREHCKLSETVNCGYDGVETAPTCEDKGYTTFTCKDCADTYQGAEKDPLGHDWILKDVSKDGRTHVAVCRRDETHTEVQSCAYDDVEIAATCTAGGYHIYTCIFCHHSYEDGRTDALGHNWNSFVFNGESHDHIKSCSRCSTQEREACDFVSGVPVAPTCKTAGYTPYTCSACGGTYEDDPVATTAHTFGDWKFITTSSAFYPMHRHVCEVCGTAEDGQCDLRYEVIDPTCTTQGYTRVTCKYCNRPQTRRQLTAAYGHSYSGWTYTGNGENDTHAKICARCGLKTAEKACNMVSSKTAATCVAPGVEADICTECGHTENEKAEEMLNHVLSGYVEKGDGAHYRYCTRPNCNYTEEEDCQYTTTIIPATCTTRAETKDVCEFCRHTVVTYHDDEEPTGHKFVNNVEITDTEHKATCSVCGYSRDGAHDYSESNICSICGHGGLVYERPMVNGHEAAYYVVKSADKVASAKNIIIPDRIEGLPVEYLSNYLFYKNNSIETVVLPRTLKEIGQHAFDSCANLKSVTFAGGEEKIQLTKIDDYAFRLATRLSDVELPEGLALIGSYAFFGCSSLADVDVPDSVKDIGHDAFRNAKCYKNSGSRTNGALYLGKHLIKVDSVPADGEFRIAEGTVSVSRACFENLKSLVKIYLPSSLTTVDEDAFKGCTVLQSVTFGGKVADWLSVVFENDLASPMHFASELHIDGAAPNREDGTLDLSALEEIRTFTSIPAGTFRGVKAIKKVIIPEQVTEIGSNAFSGCSDLVTVEVKGTLKKLGVNVFDGTAFYDNDSNWDNGVLYLGDAAGNYYLLEAENEKLPENGIVTIKEKTLIVCAEAFNGCTNLEEITIPATVRYIGEKAFVGSGLISATFEGEKLSFLAFNGGGAGRYYDDDELKDPAWAANNLKNYLTGYWTKLQG